MTIPTLLYHATTPKKFEKYQTSKCIIPPIRVFNTIEGAIAWSLHARRSIIIAIPCNKKVYKLPDHHNRFGIAYWCDGSVAFEDLTIVFNITNFSIKGWE